MGRPPRTRRVVQLEGDDTPPVGSHQRLVTNLAGAFEETIHTRTAIDCALIHVTFVQEKVRTGKYPTSLSQIPPERLDPSRRIDPFSGQPYIFRTGDGVPDVQCGTERTRRQWSRG